jgi:hypothetical protein
LRVLTRIWAKKGLVSLRALRRRVMISKRSGLISGTKKNEITDNKDDRSIQRTTKETTSTSNSDRSQPLAEQATFVQSSNKKSNKRAALTNLSAEMSTPLESVIEESGG